jgi:hypothetical protein
MTQALRAARMTRTIKGLITTDEPQAGVAAILIIYPDIFQKKLLRKLPHILWLHRIWGRAKEEENPLMNTKKVLKNG